MNMTNRDYPTPADEHWVKKAALECAEKNALPADDLDRYEMFLLVGLLSRGLLSLSEFEEGELWLGYDGLYDPQSKRDCHHVYVYNHNAPGAEGKDTLLLTIVCNQ